MTAARRPRARATIDGLRRLPTDRPLLATALCAVIAACFPVIAMHQVVFGGRTLSTSLIVPGVNGFHPPTGADPPVVVPADERVDPGASAWQTEPWAELIARMQADGDWPLWNPNEAAGKPLAADAVSAPFDPLLAFVNDNPTPLVWDLSLLFAFSLGSVATFLLLDSFGIRRLAALVGSAAFSIGGYFALFGNNPFARGYIYLPILLYLIDRVVAERAPPWTIALGVGLAASVLVGMPEISFFVVGVAVLYALYRLFDTTVGDERRRALLRLGIGAGLGVALTLPLLLIFIRYEGLADSTHQAGAGTGSARDPIRNLLTWGIPFVNGRPLASFNPPGFLSGVRGWVGAGAVAAAATCVAAPLRFLTARRAPFFAGVAVLLVWKDYGLPGSKEVGELPVLERINFTAYGPMLLQFCLAVLAAIGLDALLRGRIHLKRLAVVAGVGAVGGLLLLRSNRLALDAAPTAFEARWIGLAGAAAGVVLLAGWAVVARPRWRPVVGTIAAFVVLVEVLALFPRNSFEQRAEPFRRPPWQALVAHHGRGAGTDRVFGLDAVLFPDTATALDLYDIRTIDPLVVGRWVEYVRAFVSPGYVDRFAGGPFGSGEGDPLYADNPMFDLFGVKYVVSEAIAGSEPTSIVEYASRTGRAQFQRADVAFGQDVRDAAVAKNGQEFGAPVPASGDAVSLQVSYALPPGTRGRPVTFVVEGLDANGARVPLWRAGLDPELGQSLWNDAEIDLRAVPVPLRSVALRVETSGPGAGAWAGVRFVDAEGRAIGDQYAYRGLAGGVTVYENTHAAPRAFVVHDVTAVGGEHEALRLLRSKGRPIEKTGRLVDEFDPRTEAVVETSGSVEDLDGTCDAAASDRVDVLEYRPLEVRLRVDAACAGLVVLSDIYYPDWQATVNGHDARVLPTDLAFRGVRVPAGSSTVVFRYQSDDFDLGLWVARLATLAALVWLLAWGVSTRRAAGGASTAPRQ